MLVCNFDWRGFAKVDARAGVHDWGGREDVVDCDGIRDGVEGGDDAAEGFERGERMKWGLIGD